MSSLPTLRIPGIQSNTWQLASPQSRSPWGFPEWTFPTRAVQALAQPQQLTVFCGATRQLASLSSLWAFCVDLPSSHLRVARCCPDLLATDITAVFIIVDEIYVWMNPERSVSWEPRRETGLFVEEAGRVQRFRGSCWKLRTFIMKRSWSLRDTVWRPQRQKLSWFPLPLEVEHNDILLQ